MQRTNERITPPEFEPDPQLRLSSGRASGLQIASVALACAFILGLMIYGLGRPSTSDGNIMASAPPAQGTTGSAPPAEPPAPRTGGNVAGGENAAPGDRPAPQNQPAQEQVPQRQKPGAVEDDSRR